MNGTNQPISEITTDDNAKKRFLENFSYVRNSYKNKAHLKKWGVCAVITALILAFLKGSPPTEDPISTSLVTPYQIEQSPTDPTTANYSRSDDIKTFRTSSNSNTKAVIKLSGPKLISRPKNLKVALGTTVKAKLLSGASNGLLKAVLVEELRVNGESLIEAGSIFIGQGSSSEDRLMIRFNKVLHKDGEISKIQAEASDLSDQIVGVKGSKLTSRAIKMAASAGLKFLAGASQALQETEGQQGVAVTKPTVKNAVLNGTAQASLEQANEIASGYKNAPPLIEVPAGTEIYILFSDTGD